MMKDLERKCSLLEVLQHTNGKKIFNEVVTYFLGNNMPLIDVIVCASDGVPFMTGKYKGFVAKK